MEGEAGGSGRLWTGGGDRGRGSHQTGVLGGTAKDLQRSNKTGALEACTSRTMVQKRGGSVSVRVEERNKTRDRLITFTGVQRRGGTTRK